MGCDSFPALVDPITPARSRHGVAPLSLRALSSESARPEWAATAADHSRGPGTQGGSAQHRAPRLYLARGCCLAAQSFLHINTYRERQRSDAMPSVVHVGSSRLLCTKLFNFSIVGRSYTLPPARIAIASPNLLRVRSDTPTRAAPRTPGSQSFRDRTFDMWAVLGVSTLSIRGVLGVSTSGR
jgi:hypothetical protein